MRAFLLIAVAFLAAPAVPACAATLRESSGLVQVRPSGSDRWAPAGKPPRILKPGDALRTGFNARAVLDFDGTATVEAAGNTQLALDESQHGGAVVDLLFGSVQASARALGGRALEVRAQTAVARARSESVSWRAAVGGGGNALFEVKSGLVSVEDSRGGALRLRDGERVEVDLAGLHEPTAAPTPARARHDEFADRMRRELAYDREPDDAQRLVAGEVRRNEYELGHALTDASGARVRAEEFVVRLSPSSFEFVALNGRRGAGLSWYSWNGTFDIALPRDLSAVFASLPGSLNAPAPWTLTGFTETRSNGIDALVGVASGGHQVDLNHNADATDDITFMYNPVSDGFTSVGAGQAAFKTLFDHYSLTSDGVFKRGWNGVNIQSQNDAVVAPAFTSNTTFPDASSVQQVVLESYGDGTQIQTQNRAVSPGGGVVSRAAFGGDTSGAGWQGGLLRSAFQQTTTASEFGGRSIDVMLSARVLVETGGLP
jgi:hypothetical protein